MMADQYETALAYIEAHVPMARTAFDAQHWDAFNLQMAMVLINARQIQDWLLSSGRLSEPAGSSLDFLG